LLGQLPLVAPQLAALVLESLGAGGVALAAQRRHLLGDLIDELAGGVALSGDVAELAIELGGSLE
jgi:hypothetical protein